MGMAAVQPIKKSKSIESTIYTVAVHDVMMISIIWPFHFFSFLSFFRVLFAALHLYILMSPNKAHKLSVKSIAFVEEGVEK